jgi:hypothetical protein
MSIRGFPPGAVYRNAATVIVIATAMACLFAVSYTLALGRPTRHQIATAVVGDRSRDQALVAFIERQLDHELGLVRLPTPAAASRAIAQQRVFAALLLDRPRPKLIVSSASGVSVARALEQAAGHVPSSADGPLLTVDERPLPATDPDGLVAFYITIAATILGFVTMFHLRANAPGVSLRVWLVCVATLAAVGGLGLATVTLIVVGPPAGHWVELWALIGAEIGAAAVFNSAMLALIGKWAIVPAWCLFIAIGNAASGGAIPPPLLPGVYRVIGRLLPNGATVEAIRNVMYFPQDQHLQPIAVETAWLAGALLVLLFAGRHGRSPSAS